MALSIIPSEVRAERKTNVPIAWVGSTTIEIALAWRPVSGAKSYLLERSASPDFSTPTKYVLPGRLTGYGDTGQAPDATSRFTMPPNEKTVLEYGTTYYYRLQAILPDTARLDRKRQWNREATAEAAQRDQSEADSNGLSLPKTNPISPWAATSTSSSKKQEIQQISASLAQQLHERLYGDASPASGAELSLSEQIYRWLHGGALPPSHSTSSAPSKSPTTEPSTIAEEKVSVPQATLFPPTQLVYSDVVAASLAPQPVRGRPGDLWADVVLGQPDFGQNVYGKTTAQASSWAGGVAVDRYSQPNRLYLADTNHNRILGFEMASKIPWKPSVVIGQPNFINLGACNGDGTMQTFPKRAHATASTLCLIPPDQISIGETVFHAGMAVDDKGALYVTDTFNHRILKYAHPFVQTMGQEADDIWGQADWETTSCNRGGFPDKNTLCLSGGDAFSSGLAFDGQGNLWVADAGNHRVLRFPKQASGRLAHDADLVLGQPNFNATQRGFGLHQMSYPWSVAVDREGRRLFVGDISSMSQPEQSRVLEFDLSLPLSNGAQALHAISVSGTPFYLQVDPLGKGLWVQGFFPVASTSSEKTIMALIRLFMLHDSVATLTLSVPVVQGDGFDLDPRGDLYAVSKWYELIRLKRPSLDVARDNPNVLTQAKETVFSGKSVITAESLGPCGPTGAAVFKDQLIISEGCSRLLMYNHYNASTIRVGQPADDLYGEDSFTDLTQHHGFWAPQVTGDLFWVVHRGSGGLDLQAFRSPLTHTSVPVVSIRVAGEGARGFSVLGGGTLQVKGGDSFDFAVDTQQDAVWITDVWNSRIFRLRHPASQTQVYVDVVLGQSDLQGTQCNRGRGPDSPTRATLCTPYNVTLDSLGNVYVTDNGGEAGSNSRILEFDRRLFTAEGVGRAQYGTEATRVFGTAGDFTRPGNRAFAGPLVSPFKPAFDPRTGYMVVCANPYKSPRFPFIFFDPLRLYDSDQRLGSLPHMVLGDFQSYPIFASFDQQGNLYIADYDWSRLLVYRTPLAKFSALR